MVWSTRRLAELAGTTVKAVRYYHEVGLLDEPERASNGYKQYGVAHLVRLLRIKRLSDLGVPLAQIATLGDTATRPDDALRVIDAELAETIERLQRVRAELAMILQNRAPTDLPPGFGEGTADLSEADRALLLIYSRVFSPHVMDELREMVQDSRRSPVDEEFDALPANADEDTRQQLAEHYAPHLQEYATSYPWLSDLGVQAPHTAASAGSVVVEAVSALYNPAQLDVLRRALAILGSDPD